MTHGPQDPQPGGSAPQQWGRGEPPYGQQPSYEQPPYGQQAPYGQQPSYGQPLYGQQAPYGQQGWGYPAAPGQQQEPLPPTPRPTTVIAAVAVLGLNVLLGLVTSVRALGDLDTRIDEAAARQGVDAESVRQFAEVGVVIGAVVGGLFLVGTLVVLWFAWTGRNWARVTLWVLAGLSLLSGVVGLAVGSTVDVGGDTALTVIGLLLQAAGVVLLALRPSSAWYRAEGQRRARY
jgi:hypothetical protein